MINNTTTKLRWWRLRPSEIGLIIVILLGFMIVLFGGHLFNRNRLEIANRAVCQANLIKIRDAIAAQGLSLKSSSAGEIIQVISSLDLACPSGVSIHDSDHRDSYFVDVQDNEQIITEDVMNHDTSRMWFVDLPSIRFILWSDGRVTKEAVE